MSRVDPHLVAAIAACLGLIALAFAIAGRIAAGAIDRSLGNVWPEEAAHPDVIAMSDAAHAHSSEDGEA